MEVIEISAPTLDAAKSAAADKLGVPVDSLTVSVLEESKGLFGKSSVKIRAEAAGGAAEAPAKPKRGAKPAKAAVAVSEDEPEAEEVAAPQEEERPARRGRSAKAKDEEPAPGVEATNGEAPVAEVVATEEDADKV